MEFSAQQIAEFLKGTIVGDPEIKVNDLSKIEEGKPGTLTFLSNPKYTEHIYSTQASIVLVNDTFTPEKPIAATLIKVEDAYKSLALLLNLVEMSKPKKTGIDSSAHISESAKIGENVYIAAFAYVGENAIVEDNAKIYPHTYIGDNAKVGENTTLFSGVKIYENCKIGKDCILHAGAVIGSDGFGFAPRKEGGYDKLPQIGNVVIEDNVEIGANCTIDCATMGSTIIKSGVKLDNLVHLAHNVEVGNDTAIAAQCGISGSTKIGKNCIFGGQVGVGGHISIANSTIIGAQSGISSSVKNTNGTFLGTPINDIAKQRRVYAATRSLPELQATVLELKKEIAALKELLNK